MEKITLLDGATGTELARRGFDVNVPGWSAAALVGAPELVYTIHADYVAAGADVITANTFRTHARNVTSAGFLHSAAELTAVAVELAREAAAGRALVAGSQAPLEDCYAPALVPDEAALRDEHLAHARHLADAGVDLILIETMNTIGEAVAASAAARETGTPFWVSFVCTTEPDGRLLSGERLAAAVAAVRVHEPAAVLINCVSSPAIAPLLRVLRAAAPDLAVGAYANTAECAAEGRWTETPARDPAVYVRYTGEWLAAGADIVGGCCGTTPAHIAALKKPDRERISGGSLNFRG